MATEETKMKKQDLKFNKNEDAMKLKLSALQRKIDKIHLGGGEKKVKKHHSKGKLTARERIALLLDKDSDYVEMGEFAGYGMYEQYGGCPSGGVVIVIGYVSGKQCVVVAIDSRRNYNIEKGKNIFSEKEKKFWFEVFIYGGKKETGLDVVDWAKKIEELGAGEILLTSIDRDGTKDGYDILLTNEIVKEVGIPVIASGGCGKPEDMIDVFQNTEVSAALAASIFHYETHSVNRVKQMIKENGIHVRY